MTCPSFAELCAVDASTGLRGHLSTCPRCRAIVLRVGGSHPALHSPSPVFPAPRTGPPPAAGGVWTFWAPDMEEYLVGAVLESDAEEALIVPLLTETSWASEADIALPADVMGYAALAPVWAADRVLTEQAVEAVNVLSERHLDGLIAGYDAFFSGEPVADPGGPPALSNSDPRLAAHAALADNLRPLYSPWSLLHIADELGPVLAHRREDVGIDLKTWSTDLDVQPQIWSAFEAGNADPNVGIPVAVMGRAVRGLGLLSSRRVLTLAHASVVAHHEPEALVEGGAMARRRRGAVPRRRRDPEAASTAADQYAAALAKELGL
jgi:hypothetical protein